MMTGFGVREKTFYWSPSPIMCVFIVAQDHIDLPNQTGVSYDVAVGIYVFANVSIWENLECHTLWYDPSKLIDFEQNWSIFFAHPMHYVLGAQKCAVSPNAMKVSSQLENLYDLQAEENRVSISYMVRKIYAFKVRSKNASKQLF